MGAGAGLRAGGGLAGVVGDVMGADSVEEVEEVEAEAMLVSVNKDEVEAAGEAMSAAVGFTKTAGLPIETKLTSEMKELVIEVVPIRIRLDRELAAGKS